jgi:hypothetical protein
LKRELSIRSLGGRSGSIGTSAVPALLTVLMPKCPICWMALMSSLGVGSTIGADWLRPIAFGLLLLPVIALFIRARRCGRYGAFLLGIVAASAMYFCKFELFSDPGVYLSGLGLVGASIWNAAIKRRTHDFGCRC